MPQLRRVAIGIAAAGGLLFAVSAGIAIAKYSKYDVTPSPPVSWRGIRAIRAPCQPLAAHHLCDSPRSPARIVASEPPD